MGLFDRADYEIVRNWDVIGMQGTGSDRVVVDEVFVPAHRTKPYPPTDAVLPAEIYRDSPLFHGPARPFIITESAAVIVGAAQGALDVYEETFRARKATGPTGAARADWPSTSSTSGAAARLSTRRVLRCCRPRRATWRWLSRTSATGEPSSDDDVRRLTMVILQSIHLAHEAVDIMFRTAGSSASKKDSLLGRYWRNVGVLRGHLAHQSDSAAINYGRVHFGHSPVGIS